MLHEPNLYIWQIKFDLLVKKKKVSNLHMHQNHLESLLKHRFLGHTAQFLNSVGVGWGLRISISTCFQVLLVLLVSGS